MTLAEETAPLGPVLDGIAASSPAWRVLVDGWPRWRLWRAQWKRMRVPKERRAAWRRLYFARLHTWRAEAQRRVDAARCWDTGALSRRLLHIWNDATNDRGSPQLVPGYAARRGYWRGKINPRAVTFKWANDWDATTWPAPAVRAALRRLQQAARTWLRERARTVVEFDGDGVPFTPPVFELDSDWTTAKETAEWKRAAETVARIAPHLLTTKDRRLLGVFQVIHGRGLAPRRGKLRGPTFDLEWKRAA